MAKTTTNPRGKRRRITFLLDDPGAREVILMGDFNQWDPKVHPMKKDDGGMWKKITMLFPGRYEYRFLVDGRWENDPDNERTCPNSFGTYNNVVIVT